MNKYVLAIGGLIVTLITCFIGDDKTGKMLGPALLIMALAVSVQDDSREKP